MRKRIYLNMDVFGGKKDTDYYQDLSEKFEIVRSYEVRVPAFASIISIEEDIRRRRAVKEMSRKPQANRAPGVAREPITLADSMNYYWPDAILVGWHMNPNIGKEEYRFFDLAIDFGSANGDGICRSLAKIPFDLEGWRNIGKGLDGKIVHASKKFERARTLNDGESIDAVYLIDRGRWG